ncbi:MAG: DUF2177 family protein [Blastocatellales bacterium]|nr:DUF2177 family protein [Nitrosomonas nitrosa]
MNTKRILLGSIAAFVVMFILGGLWNAVLMTSFYERHAPSNARPPAETSLLFVVLGYVLLVAFMTFLLAQSFRTRPSVLESFQFGALFGVIATLPIYLILYAIWNVSLTMLLVDSGWHLVQEGIGAVVLGLTMFSPKPKEAEAIR